MAATRAREAAVTRFIRFEILQAAFVICHLHLARVLAQIGAPPLGNNHHYMLYLANSLTGWTDDGLPTGHTLLFPELEAELRDAAVAKHHDPILAVIGNPPYEGYSTADNDEERALLADWILAAVANVGIRGSAG